MVLLFVKPSQNKCHPKNIPTQTCPLLQTSEESETKTVSRESTPDLTNVTKPSRESCTPETKTYTHFHTGFTSNPMDSICFPLCSESKNVLACMNPDICTSAGIVAAAYPRFRTNFWLDRILFYLTVLIPSLQGLLLLLIHAILGVTRCIPVSKASVSATLVSNSFVDRACGLQLTSEVLRGTVKTVPTSFDSNQVPSETISSIRLQHECYPFILIILAIIMWIPHYLYHRAVDKTARRDMCLVRSELHSFRRAVTQELAYLQTLAAVSTDAGLPTTTFLSPGSTLPQGTVYQRSTTCCHHVPIVASGSYAQNDGTSARTTAATVGAASLQSQTPAPTVIHAHQQRSGTLGTVRCGLTTEALRSSPAPPPLSCGDADFSAPGLLDLPCFHACHADWSLNTYLAAWQNTDFYWIRYFAKHTVLAVFEACTIITIFALVGHYKGSPFAALFDCHLHGTDRDTMFLCMLQTTYLINMSILSLGFLHLAALILQAIYFYANFVHSFWIFGSEGTYLGVTSRPTTFITGVDETRRCFFADYIRLLAYTAFRDTHCEIRTMSVTYSPRLYRSDFHFVSLLCTENAYLLPDAIHIHFWTERYARLCKRRFVRPYLTFRRGSFTHLVRCEDLSMKFNFSKIKIKVEVDEFSF